MDMLIASDVLEALRHGEATSPPSAEDRLAFASQLRDRQRRNLRIVGNVAEIRIEGVLTKRPSLLAMLFGGGNTTYGDVMDALAAAKNDRLVKSAVLLIDSPGGQVDGLFELLGALESFEKPLSVRAANALSAAYAIAAVAGPIEATNVGAAFGSVGAAASYWVSDRIVDLTNTDSPEKRPDPRTATGQAVVRRHLDAIFDLFVDAIARGRKTSSARVRAEYGRGATLLAGEARKRGMIDVVLKPGAAPPGSAMAAAQRAIAMMEQAPARGFSTSAPAADEDFAAQVATRLEQRLGIAPAQGPETEPPANPDLAAEVAARLEQRRGKAVGR